VTKKYGCATTLHGGAEAHPKVADHDKALLADTYITINPAATQRRIQALASELLTLTTSNAGPKTKALLTAPPRACLVESNESRLRAHLDLRQQAVFLIHFLTERSPCPTDGNSDRRILSILGAAIGFAQDLWPELC
jgi:hypothetical protein